MNIGIASVKNEVGHVSAIALARQLPDLNIQITSCYLRWLSHNVY